MRVLQALKLLYRTLLVQKPAFAGDLSIQSFEAHERLVYGAVKMSVNGFC